MSEERTEQPKSWLGKITSAFSDEPRNRNDLLDDLRQANTDKLIDDEALTIVEGALELSDMQVRDVMIPRSQMVVVEQDQTPAEFLPLIISSAHSRFPVIKDNQDEIIGILLAKDLLSLINKAELESFDLKSRLRKATFIPESKRLLILLKEFRATRNHMAIVMDEYGGVSGLITIEDVLEQIVGEIEDEHDNEDSDTPIKCFEDNAFIVKALTSVEDFNDYFSAGFPEEEFATIGGIVTSKFGRMPKKDEIVDIDAFSFKILAADTRRIRLLQVSKKY